MPIGSESRGRHVFPDIRGVQVSTYNSIRADANNTSFPAANTAAVVTLVAPGTHRYHTIGSIYWSYDGAPTGGRLSIHIGGNLVFDIDIIVGGPGYIFWQPLLEADENLLVVVTLAAPGQGITGKLNVHAWIDGG